MIAGLKMSRFLDVSGKEGSTDGLKMGTCIGGLGKWTSEDGSGMGATVSLSHS